MSVGATAITETAMVATNEAIAIAEGVAMPLQFRLICFIPPLIVMATSVGEKYEFTKAGSTWGQLRIRIIKHVKDFNLFGHWLRSL
jgi:hypothetical protein